MYSNTFLSLDVDAQISFLVPREFYVLNDTYATNIVHMYNSSLHCSIYLPLNKNVYNYSPLITEAITTLENLGMFSIEVVIDKLS